MTTIIAKRNPEKGTVDIAWDSQSTGMNVMSTQKVVNVNDQFYVGFAGRSRFSNILSYAEVPPIHQSDIQAPHFDARGYLITRVVPSWVETLQEAVGRIPEDKDDWPNGVALIVIAGRIFEVDRDFTVSESEGDVFGIGSGAAYALGAIAAGKSIEKAIQIAADLDLYTGGELSVLKGVK